MPSASAQAPLAGWKAQRLGLRRIASPKFVNGRMGLPNVNSGRGADVPLTLGERPAHDASDSAQPLCKARASDRVGQGAGERPAVNGRSRPSMAEWDARM